MARNMSTPVFMALGHLGTATATEIGERLDVSVGTVRRHLNRMVENGQATRGERQCYESELK